MKIKKNLGQVITTLAMTLAITGVMSMKTEAKSLNNIKLTAPSGKIVKVAKGKKVKLKTIVKKLKNKKVTYKSNNPRIVRVSANGTIKGLKSGKTKITVTAKSNPKIKKTVKVVVYRKAVKKIILSVYKTNLTKETGNKININLNSGERCKLKAKIKPAKGSSKILKYKSSNKSVAIVSKKGVVKAIASGKSKITVSSTDGSKKEAICEVVVEKSKSGNEKIVNKKNVNKKISIKNIKIRSNKSLNIELSEKKELEYKDFKVIYTKNKNFNDCKIKSVNTFDNIHYEVVLNDVFILDSYVKVKISKLNGVNEKEIYIDENFDYYFFRFGIGEGDTKDAYYAYRVGDNLKIDLGIYDYEKLYNFSSPVSIRYFNIPEGITTDDDGKIQGELKGLMNGHVIKVEFIDKNGNKGYLNIHLYVGDEKNIYVKAYDRTELTYKAGENRKIINGSTTFNPYDPSVLMAGGTKSDECYYDWQEFSAEGLPDNVIINKKYGHIGVEDESKDVKPGVYNITIKAVTASGVSVTIPYKLTLIEGITIKGRVTDEVGNPISYVTVEFRPNYYADNCSTITTSIQLLYDWVVVNTNQEGYYEVRLNPYNYDICIYENGCLYYSTMNELSNSQTYNIKMNLYKNN